jgi:hypothetical protein
VKKAAALPGFTALVLAAACGSGEDAEMQQPNRMAPMEGMEPSSEVMIEGSDSVAADSMMADTMMDEGMPEAMLEDSRTGGI